MNWPTVALGDVAKLERQVIAPAMIDDGTPYIGLEHIERGGRLLNYETIGNVTISSAKHKFTDDHILYGRLRPNLGKIFRPRFNGICSTDILPIRVDDGIDKGYLFHYLSQQQMIDHAARRTSGANLPRLHPKELLKFPVPVPPLDEQRRIAAILDRTNAARLDKESAVSLREQLNQSVLHKLMKDADFPLTRLEDVATISSGITKGRRTDQPTQEVPYLAVANVQSGALKLGAVKYIAATESEIKKYRLRRDDLVLTEGGDPDKLGRGTVWRDEMPICIHQNHIFRVRVKDYTVTKPEFLSSYISSIEARRYFLRSAKQTTGIASINITQLRSLPVPIAPASLQDKFLTQAVAIETRLAQARASLHTLDELHASLQARAFRGEL